MSPEYYTAKDGSIHYEEGKTSLNDGETYCILPSYSPEIIRQIITAHRMLTVLLIFLPAVIILICLLKLWATLIKVLILLNGRNLKNLPPYLYDETGALKEWATTSFDENNKHRHLSHLYGVWPLLKRREMMNCQKPASRQLQTDRVK